MFLLVRLPSAFSQRQDVGAGRGACRRGGEVMRWRLGSDRFRVQLSMETEPVEDRPAAPGRARRSGQAAVGFLAVLVLWGMFTVHGLVSEVLLDRRGIATAAGVTSVSPSRRVGAAAVVMVRFTDQRHRSAIGAVFRYGVGRRAPFAVPAAFFLVIWLGGMLMWELVVS
jgi:hypothetical protein